MLNWGRWQSYSFKGGDLIGSPETMVSNCLSARKVLITREDFPRITPLQIPHQGINWSTDCQLDGLADTAQHFYERIDGELGRFFVHHVGDPRARDHQNLGGLGLL